MRPHPPENVLAMCRRCAAAVNAADPDRKSVLTQELSGLLALLDAHAIRDPEARPWLEGEAAAIRESVLTPEVRRTAPAWAGPLLLPRELVDAMGGDGPEEYE